MSRRYDQSTTTFSPEGRLHQVEYAIEAINNAGTCVGIACNNGEGIVLAAEKRVVSKLLAPSKISEKTYPIDKHISCVVAGLSSDAQTHIERARLGAQQYLYTYQELIPVEQIVKSVCNYKQAYTQYGGMRPFGVAFLFAGYDSYNGFQLYQTDPSGNYSGWKATVIGQNNQAGKSILKQEYETAAARTIEDCVKLALKILLKTMDTTTPTAARLEITVLRKKSPDSEEIESFTVTEEDVTAYLAAVQEAVQAAEQAAKQQETAVSGDK